MPINKKDYPPDWKQISLAVRTEAGWRCEWCGAKHKEVIERRPNLRYKTPGMEAYEVDWIHHVAVNNPTDGKEEFTDTMTWARLRYYRLTRIILTVAHLDRNSKNDDRKNLAALCQRCHLRYDIRQHIANRRYGRDHKREHQQKLF